MLLLLIACASDWEPEVAHVRATSPSPGADEVRLDPLLRVSFSEPMSTEPSGILLMDAQGQALNLIERWDEEPWGITLEPTAQLQPGQDYTLLVPSTLKTQKGSGLFGDLEVPFTTWGADTGQ